MQTLFKASLAAALSMAAIAPALAGDEPITVLSQAAYAQWQDEVTQSLDRRLVSVERANRATPVAGIVQLRFTLDENGQPQGFQTLTSSGDRATDRVAIGAVRGLTQLGDAPVAGAADKTFQANIIFAKSQAQHARLSQKLAKIESARLARSDSAGVISFGL